MNIAILGATGHIGQNCYHILKDRYNAAFYLFSRSSNGSLSKDLWYTYEDFNKYRYDVIINAVSIGNPQNIKNAHSTIWNITEQYDNMILQYLQSYSDSLYINFSSGAVYGDLFNTKAAEGNSYATYSVNNLSKGDHYAIAKLASEAKHRAYDHLNIIDLRVFSFFTRYIDLSHSYLMCDIVNAINENVAITTSSMDIIRDYIHPTDFGNLLSSAIDNGNINCAIDVCSKRAVSKFEILNYFKDKYGLEYIVNTDVQKSPTGTKQYYHSNADNKLLFRPEYTALECIIEESKHLVKK